MKTTKWNERITIAREALGIKKAEFARRVGVSSATTADWESCTIKMIDGAHLVRVAQVLKVTPEWLMEGGSAIESDQVVASFSWLYRTTSDEGRAFLRNAVEVAKTVYAPPAEIKPSQLSVVPSAAKGKKA